MAASGSIMPNPKWYFVDNNGEPLGAGFLYTYRSIDKTQKKFVYQDAGLTLPYADPIRIDANGTFGPMFWANDEPYYLVVRDAFGFMIWDMDNFWPSIAGGGGGGNTTNYLDIENLIPNNVFYRNGITATGATNTVTPVPATLLLAPGGHAGFSGNTALATTTGSPAPDITFNKNNTASVDTLTMGSFFPAASNFLLGDVTPVSYLNYSSNASATAFKYVQFPVCSGVQSLADQTCVGNIWVQWNAGSTSLSVAWRQFFGDGPSASADVLTSVALTLTATVGAWLRYTFTLNIPAISGKNLGECGNDGLFFQVRYDASALCDISFVKPAIYLGAVNSLRDFIDNDQLESWVNGYRTGDIRTSLNTFAPYGWVTMNDGTIGSATSGATTRANRDTYPLYAMLWNGVSDTYAPVITGRGATALADFVANKVITLTRQLGRVLGEAGSGVGLAARTLGEYLGDENSTLVQGNIPALLNITIGSTTNVATPGVEASVGGVTQVPTSIHNVGGGQSFTNMQPTTFYNMFLKL